MTIDIPGRGLMSLQHAVLDFNGTLAEDGQVSLATRHLLQQVAVQYNTIIATADTFGTVARFAEEMGISRQIVRNGDDKEALVGGLSGGVAAVGNGVNDRKMFQAADLAILVVGPEGASSRALEASDIMVPSVERALELLLNPKRLMATLRE